MDIIDKGILIELEGNCRASHQYLADKFGMTRSSIKRRVDRLVDSGVIVQFTVELSREMLNYEWLIASVRTDGTENDKRIIKEMGKEPMVFCVNRIADKSYSVYSHVVGQEGIYRLGKHLRGIKGVKEVTLHPLVILNNETLSPNSWLHERGNKVDFTMDQLRVLRCLVDDARIPVSEIAQKTGMTTKRSNRIMSELQDGGGVYFTIYMALSKSGNTSFVLSLELNETKASPRDVITWLQKEYPLDYWNSFIMANEPTMWNFFSTDHISRIEEIVVAARQKSFVGNANALIHYPNNVFSSLARIRLLEMLDEAGV